MRVLKSTRIPCRYVSTGRDTEWCNTATSGLRRELADGAAVRIERTRAASATPHTTTTGIIIRVAELLDPLELWDVLYRVIGRV